MIVIYIIGCSILAVVLVGFATPRRTVLRKEITINASPKEVFKYLNNLKLFVTKWSPWIPNSESVTAEYGKKVTGVGATAYWYGGEGNSEGGLEIIESKPYDFVKCRSTIRKSGNTELKWTITKTGDKQIVLEWLLTIDHKNNPIGRLTGGFTEKIMGVSIEESLNKLKNICEK